MRLQSFVALHLVRADNPVENKCVFQSQIHSARADWRMNMRCIAREKDVAHLEMLIDAMRNVKSRFPNRRTGWLNTRDFVNGIFLRAYDSPSLRHALVQASSLNCRAIMPPQ